MARKVVDIQFETEDGEVFHGRCLPESVKTWTDHGWTVVDDGSSEADQPTGNVPVETPVADQPDQETVFRSPDNEE